MQSQQAWITMLYCCIRNKYGYHCSCILLMLSSQKYIKKIKNFFYSFMISCSFSNKVTYRQCSYFKKLYYLSFNFIVFTQLIYHSSGLSLIILQKRTLILLNCVDNLACSTVLSITLLSYRGLRNGYQTLAADLKDIPSYFTRYVILAR